MKYLSLLLLVTGCATTPAIQRVEIPISISCVKEIPSKPSLPMVPEKGIFDQAKTLIARDKLRELYENELLVIIKACQ